MNLRGFIAGLTFLFCLIISYFLIPQISTISKTASNAGAGSGFITIYLWVFLIIFNIVMPFMMYSLEDFKILNAVIAMFVVIILATIMPVLIGIANTILAQMATGALFTSTVLAFWSAMIIIMVGLPYIVMKMDINAAF